MSSIFLNSYSIVYLFSQAIELVLSVILLFVALKLLFKWDFSSTKPSQFKLEKLAYLGSTLALFLFVAKLITAIYFVYTLDALSLYIPGAMCAAGVISANSYGVWLLGIKALILFLLLLWIALNSYDIEAKYYPIFKQKTLLLALIAILILVEFYLDISYFSSIDTSVPVSCCSTLYGNLEGQNPLPFNLNLKMMLSLFVIVFTALILSIIIDNKFTIILLSPLFLVVSYYSIVYFFGTYIYELPTHKCPFCMMQKEYNYVGYIIWSTLFFGFSFAMIYSIISIWLKKEYNNLKWYSAWLLTLFVLLNCSYVLIYYIKNHTLLGVL